MSWMDDESLKSSSGGGSYIDPRTGRKYAFMKYSYRGKRKGLWGGRRKHTGRDIIDITDDDDAFEQFKDSASGQFYRGKFGNAAYRGPGKALSQGTRYRGGGLSSIMRARSGGRSGMTPQQKQFEDYLKNTANWWDTERLSGQRGQERQAMLESQKEGLEIMRAEASEGRGWGRTQAAK